MKKMFCIVCCAVGFTVWAGENLLQNGSFENPPVRKGELAQGWRIVKSKTTGNVFLDKLNAADGKVSAQLEAERKKDGYTGTHQEVLLPSKLTEARKLRVTCRISSVDLRGGSIVIWGGIPHRGKVKGKTLVWKTVYGQKGSEEWKPVTCELELPAGCEYFAISFRNHGDGVMWVDNVFAEWVK